MKNLLHFQRPVVFQQGRRQLHSWHLSEAESFSTDFDKWLITYNTFPLSRNVTHLQCYVVLSVTTPDSNCIPFSLTVIFHRSPRALRSSTATNIPSSTSRAGRRGQSQRDSLRQPICTQWYIFARAEGRGLCVSRGAPGQVQESGNTFTLHRACYYWRLFLNGTLPKIAPLRQKRKTEISKCAS